MITKIESWKTSDGKIFVKETEAIQYEAFRQGRGAGINECIAQLQQWAHESVGGRLSLGEIQETEYFKYSLMLNDHFNKKGLI